MSATQPITLITATPGGGKTALAVQMMAEAVKQGRPLFMQGIPELRLPYIPLPPVVEWTETRVDPEDPDQRSLPYFTFPEKSLIVIDEAQRIFRVRSAASHVPNHVAAFETVRHTGVTFLLITQSPGFLDSHIRKLVGQHIHLRDVGLLGRWWYEWPEVGNPEAFKSAPIKKKWSLPKSSFGLYKSASLHIKRKYSIPPAMVVMIGAVLLAVLAIWRVYHQVEKKVHPNAEVSAKAGAPSAASGVVGAGVVAGPSPRSSDPAEQLAAFVPVVPGHPESAPAYSALREVKTMPRVVGAVCMGDRCQAFTQQGTDAGLDRSQSRRWLANRPFDPYQEVVPASALEAVREPVLAPGFDSSREPVPAAAAARDGAAEWSGYGGDGLIRHPKPVQSIARN
ncbi:zonular occludens toxin domain-containing protein [uncultured Ralstonia sp.]|mgnify:CR=1 FL=1|uniref:zonular occludens toxin domain-containing protein n=1 Tax=uncultured Ralstonia sp. TaxID=114715 RepID=UPI002632C4ED|nr:zonular occludens toxin domain-containing protein [uncultured Ralstonia sp.]